MYKYVSINKTTAAFYENLTYPAFRSRLRALDYEESIVAFGIHLDSQPVGLVLAEYSPVQNQKIATILSFFIVPQHRGKTLGKTLLTHVENELCKLGCLQVNVVYISNSTTPYWEKILKQCKWSSPQLRMLVCSGSIINIKDAAWLKLANALPFVETQYLGHNDCAQCIAGDSILGRRNKGVLSFFHAIKYESYIHRKI